MPEVWRWKPQAITETLEFETDVRITREGEWRDSLKDATQFLALSHTRRNFDAETMIETVRANALGEWLVPEWPNATISTGTLAAAATVIPVAVPAAYRIGQAVWVGFDDAAWEQRTVASLGASDITLTAGLGATYAGSASRPVIVAPLILCIAPSGIEFQSVYSVQGLSARFMSVDPVDLAANPYPLHAGLPVVTDGRVPFSPLAGSVSQAGDLLASGFGAYALQSVETFTRRRGTVSWYDRGHAARWDRRRFLHFVRGRDGEFWLPTGQNDLPLQGPVASGALTALVRPVAANAAMVGRRIVIREGASVVIREVTGAVSTGPNQSLSIAAPGVAFTTAATVSFAVRSRLDTDQMEIGYLFAGGGLAATCAAPVVEVP
jgi:hypothetical protein